METYRGRAGWPGSSFSALDSRKGRESAGVKDGGLDSEDRNGMMGGQM